MGSKQRHLGIVLAGLAVWALTGCDAAPEQSEAAAPLQVSVLTLQTQELSVSEDLPARVAAVRSAAAALQSTEATLAGGCGDRVPKPDDARPLAGFARAAPRGNCHTGGTLQVARWRSSRA